MTETSISNPSLKPYQKEGKETLLEMFKKMPDILAHESNWLPEEFIRIW